VTLGSKRVVACSVPSATFLSGWIVYVLVVLGGISSPEGSCGVKGFLSLFLLCDSFFRNMSLWYYSFFPFWLHYSTLTAEPVLSFPSTPPLAACSAHGTTTNDSSLSASGACPSGVVMTLVGVGSILVLVNLILLRGPFCH